MSQGKKSGRPKQSNSRSVKAPAPKRESQRPNYSNGWRADSLSFMVIAYVVLPTITIGSMVLYYFFASSGLRFSVIVVGAWVVLRGFPTIVTRWFGKPIPTDKRYTHGT